MHTRLAYNIASLLNNLIRGCKENPFGSRPTQTGEVHIFFIKVAVPIM